MGVFLNCKRWKDGLQIVHTVGCDSAIKSLLRLRFAASILRNKGRMESKIDSGKIWLSILLSSMFGGKFELGGILNVDRMLSIVLF